MKKWQSSVLRFCSPLGLQNLRTLDCHFFIIWYCSTQLGMVVQSLILLYGTLLYIYKLLHRSERVCENITNPIIPPYNYLKGNIYSAYVLANICPGLTLKLLI